ncbi:response regulator transcription factor [Actinomadura barringtoniae]|uniref:Response regulator transcription factor n=1 Tax=Actinomadura barringtoniae TaxID=1427535 RepID=A0A939P7Q7_9ACTN|nr:LuxR C-terminal-related transcriptional regulator [Actinomadura barringtoniae]MBO2447200.1 response regulator transcription factor [Actinomadura barringtoniae]
MTRREAVETTGRPESPDREALTGVQREILALLCSGMTDAAVARTLGISTRTVKRHVRQAMEHLGARSRLELGIRLGRHGLL